MACDFIALANQEQVSSDSALTQDLQRQQQLTNANCFAQSRVLMLGSAALGSEVADKQQHIAGNNPSTTILLDMLTPYALGSLIALYEHKTFVESLIYKINPFSQDGVELGKKIANDLYAGKLQQDLDPSSAALMRRAGLSSN